MTDSLGRWRIWALGLLLALLAARVASLALYPLGDTTEARYAEVARLMLESGDWVMPQNDPGVPFWAKPPLSFWTQATTMAVFGVNEFGARIGSVLLALGVLAALAPLARRAGSEQEPMTWLYAALLLATMPLFFVMAGTVMTDMALTVSTTLAMTAFWRAWQGDRRWGVVFFVALGLGLLAKGPVALALTAVALFLWWVTGSQRRTHALRAVRVLPWVTGGLALVLIAAPWYALAEWRTPGFLRYFIVGEHMLRFIEPDWQGDLYGNAHREPRGMSWVFFAYATFPWLLWVVWGQWHKSRLEVPSATEGSVDTSHDRYLLAWVVAAPLFFTLAGNTIWSYVLPSLPALALWLARRLSRAGAAAQRATLLAGTAVCAVLIGFVLWWLPRPEVGGARSTKALLQSIGESAQTPQPRVRFVHHLPHSTKFYARGSVKKVAFADTAAELAIPGELFLIVAPIDLGITTPEWDGPATARATRNVGRFGPWLLLHRPAH